MSKVLVLYYSFEGHTEKIAQSISQNINADIIQITPKKELPSKGFSKYLWGGKQVMTGEKPPILPENLAQIVVDYDLILLGSPIWAGTFAPAVKTLLEDVLSNKKIAYFCTHKGGAQNALKKGQQAIEINNIFVSAIDLANVSSSFESCSKKAIEWAQQII